MKNNHPTLSKKFLLNFTLRSGLKGNLQQRGSKYLYLWSIQNQTEIKLNRNQIYFHVYQESQFESKLCFSSDSLLLAELKTVVQESRESIQTSLKTSTLGGRGSSS